MIVVTGGRAFGAISLVTALALGACEAPGLATPAPAPTVAIPAGWVTVSTADASAQMVLPPWLSVSDNHGAIFANEPPPPGSNEVPIQLMFLPNPDDRPGPAEDVIDWIEKRLGDRGQGTPRVTAIDLPVGRAIRYDRVDRDGTPTSWRIRAFGITTATGVAFLLIDGLPDVWPGREDDIERIPFLVRIR